MGNKDSKYEFIEENDEKTPKLPPICVHPKGKPYGKLIEIKLKGKFPNEWSYYEIYDLRVGNKSPWYFAINIFGEELECTFCITHMENDKTLVDKEFLLKYSTESNNYMTIMKGYNKNINIRLELYADNIHCQRIENIKFKHKCNIWGFITFDDQHKIPISF